MAVRILPAYEDGGQLLTALLDLGSHEADGETNALLVGRVGVGAVDKFDVVKRHLASLENHVYGVGFVDVDCHFLASG